jgi:hypothetical protein
MGRNQSKNTPLECMVKNLKKGFNGNYGVKLTPNKLKVLCEVDWPALAVVSLDKTVVKEVYSGIVGRPGIQNNFPIMIAGRMLSSAGSHG